MARLLGQLGITQADVVGLSLGGGVAQKLTLEHRGRVRRLVLIASIDSSVPFPTSSSEVLSFAVLLGLLRMPVYGGRLIARGFRDAFHDPTKLTPELARGYLAPLRQPGTFGTLRRVWSNLGAEEPADLGAINVPTLVIGAAHDLPERGEPLARRIPGAQFVEIENAGHAVTFEQPEAIANAIARFLGSETVELAVTAPRPEMVSRCGYRTVDKLQRVDRRSERHDLVIVSAARMRVRRRPHQCCTARRKCDRLIS